MRDLELDEWLSIIGLVLAVPPLVAFFFSLLARVRRASPRIALHEFLLLVRQPWHVVLVLMVLAGTSYVLAFPAAGFPQRLVVLVPVVAAVSLTASFFLAQSRQLSGAVIVNEIRRLSRSVQGHRKPICSAIRFDVDRLKAITNYSPQVGERIRETVAEVIAEEVGRLRRLGLEVAALEIPGEDETVVIVSGLSVDEAADVADEVRRRVKQKVRSIPYYAEAVAFVGQGMSTPPTRDEEREGIGTVSAGVAADRGIPEILLSDVSAAVKESKTHGRNKTVIYRPGQAAEIRSDYRDGGSGSTGVNGTGQRRPAEGGTTSG
ncbi:GGDEF domain-containing protein [Plantactinospora endophytica]|uniref:GGDEF domain-containing protein n=1 Tax=Plantactinospora endophytica TaxID=673535 RepID=A0ABQ4DS59_9ACTN|nr:GGDEF domain-containing protein [Plantactinospora endophytica]GIG85300.1 hypothetical protein Pen02_02360 [Plantactinospora endophytica]